MRQRESATKAIHIKSLGECLDVPLALPPSFLETPSILVGDNSTTPFKDQHKEADLGQTDRVHLRGH